MRPSTRNPAARSPFARQQPARAFRDPEAHQRVEDRRKRRDAEHPAPRVFADAAEQQRSRRRRSTMPKTMLNWNMPAEPSAMRRRRDLRDVERRDHRRDADADAADEARDDERVDVPRKSRSQPRRGRRARRSRAAWACARSDPSAIRRSANRARCRKAPHPSRCRAYRRSGPRALESSAPRRK